VVRTALAVGAALLLSRLWFLAHRALDLDEYEHAHAAWSVARGLLPYRDFFEHHPPALYLLFAPLFSRSDVTTDPAAATRVLVLARLVMWTMTIAGVAIVYRLGALVRNRVAGATAVVLLVTSSRFVESMLEFRPDVPAVLCLLIAVWALVESPIREPHPPSASRSFLAGVALGAALLFTQKAIFAAPGLALALIVTRRAAAPAAFVCGALTPMALTMWWFQAHGALEPLWYHTVTVTSRLNADRISPFPRLLSNLIQQPAICVLGVLGTIVRLKPDVTEADAAAADTTLQVNAAPSATVPATSASAFRRTLIVFPALSLIAGIFIIGRAYDQYYALLWPFLAVCGGALASDLFTRAGAPAAPAAVAMMLALAALSTGISARAFEPIAPQADDIAFVSAHTRPADIYIGGSPGAALFRPHGWFYFFLTGPFAAERDYDDLLLALEAGRLRPRVVIRDRYLEARATPALLAYLDAHYRRARGDVYLRQSEYGSASLNTSDASDRLERPFTR
jgi:dolichyl-phosphate-mannose-protein mannosyltransferase